MFFNFEFENFQNVDIEAVSLWCKTYSGNKNENLIEN